MSERQGSNKTTKLPLVRCRPVPVELRAQLPLFFSVVHPLSLCPFKNEKKAMHPGRRQPGHPFHPCPCSSWHPLSLSLSLPSLPFPSDMGIHKSPSDKQASRKRTSKMERGPVSPPSPTFCPRLASGGVSHHSPLPRALHWSGTTAPNLPACVEFLDTTPRPWPIASGQNLVYATAMAGSSAWTVERASKQARGDLRSPV